MGVDFNLFFTYLPLKQKATNNRPRKTFSELQLAIYLPKHEITAYLQYIPSTIPLVILIFLMFLTEIGIDFLN